MIWSVLFLSVSFLALSIFCISLYFAVHNLRHWADNLDCRICVLEEGLAEVDE